MEPLHVRFENFVMTLLQKCRTQLLQKTVNEHCAPGGVLQKFCNRLEQLNSLRLVYMIAVCKGRP